MAGHRIFAFVFLAGAGLLSSGCYPYHFSGTPGPKGRVVDARTHAPLAGVKVIRAETFATTPTFQNGSTFTDANGLFLIPFDGDWKREPPDPFGALFDAIDSTFHCWILIHPGGYEMVSKAFSTTASGPPVVDLGTLPVKKKSP